MMQTGGMSMTAMATAAHPRALELTLAVQPRDFGLMPCTGIGHGSGVQVHSWTNAAAVTTKARKAFGAYGARRLEEHST